MNDQYDKIYRYNNKEHSAHEHQKNIMVFWMPLFWTSRYAYARLMLNHSDGERDVTGEVYIQYSYDFEKKRAAQVWEFILDQIVTCPSLEDIPTLDELRERVKNSGLL